MTQGRPRLFFRYVVPSLRAAAWLLVLFSLATANFALPGSVDCDPSCPLTEKVPGSQEDLTGRENVVSTTAEAPMRRRPAPRASLASPALRAARPPLVPQLCPPLSDHNGCGAPLLC